jgi:pantoate--beta-alanine ligase
MTTRLVHTRADLRKALPDRTGEVAVVMTLGALHDGHRELIKVARRRCQVIVVTVFLNPLQFAPSEDLSRYPKTLDADVALCAEEDVDLVFAPSVEEVYPTGEPQVRVHAGPLGDVLEGASRPGHFDGVLTVVAKLLHLTSPDVAYFGQKDAQQVAVIRRMVRDLDHEVEIRVVAIIRDADGLALSSRNAYLSPEERKRALALPRALATKDPAQARARLNALDVDYVEVADFEPRVLVAAVRVGKTRLIDNVVFDKEPA